ncbi:ABC transporter permease [Halobacteriales archaeon SW_7_68_16]|nr:MAG: ABC transporter permease [Halobacteriales archaeon SW_7_68_16]
MVLVGVLVAALLDGTVAASTKALTDGVAGIATGFTDLPTLLTRELIPSDGYYRPGVGWMETFPQNIGLGAGLAPAHAWAVRVLAVYTYAFVLLAWVWKGYTLFRDRYRYADWTPRDDVVRRLRGHYWGQFGMIVVIAFIVFALFAPTLGPTTVEDNIYNPYGNTFEYYDDGAGEVVEITHGTANRDTISQGDNANVGPLSYDQYGRWHPFGTLTSGKDLFTFMAAGARVSLFIAILALLIAGGVGATMALVTAYYKGLLDLGTVVASDSVQSIPGLVALILLSEVFSGHPLANVYNGGFLLALFIGLISWPAYWRAIRGPAFQVAEKEWIDAAKSFGQRPTTTMRKHIAPYVVGYLLIYASLAIGGVIISVAALSFLGLGVNPPTPEWGRAVNAGRPYISTASWHIATIPGVMVVIVVTGFNALGDGIRDAIDPQSDTGESGAAATAGGG